MLIIFWEFLLGSLRGWDCTFADMAGAWNSS